MAASARDKFDANIRHLLTSGDHSDLTITCGEDTYKVHRNIVCARSEFFKRSLTFPGKEAEAGTINLPKDDPATIKLLIQYLYEAEYDPKLPASHTAHLTDKSLLQSKDKLNLGNKELHYIFPHTCSRDCPEPHRRVCHHHLCSAMTCNNSCADFVCKECCSAWHTSLKTVSADLKQGDPAQCLLHSQMYALADKYQIDGLVELASAKFKACCTVFWYTAEFVSAAEHVFEDMLRGDHGLRWQVAGTIAKHMELLNKPQVAALLDEDNGLAASLVRLKAGVLGWRP